MSSTPRLRIAITVPQDPRHAADRVHYRELERLADDHPVEVVRNDRWVTRVVDGPRLILARERWRVTSRTRPQRAAFDLVFAFGTLPLWVPHHARLVWHHAFVRPDGMDPADWRAKERGRHRHAARRANCIAVPDVDQVATCAELFPFAADKIDVLPYYTRADLGPHYLAVFDRVVETARGSGIDG